MDFFRRFFYVLARGAIRDNHRRHRRQVYRLSQTQPRQRQGDYVTVTIVDEYY